MARRKRRGGREPVWPLLMIVGFVALGLVIGNLVTPGGGDAASAAGPLPSDPLPSDPGEVEVPSPENRVRVEVLNGSGIPGMAARATEVLRASGLDVVYLGNESSFDRDSSVILGRTGRDGDAEAAGRVLGIARVGSEPDTTRLVDVTVLLGADWHPPAGRPAGPAEDGGTSRAWWDPRRLLDE